jgi:hypothetical protein
VLSARLLAFAAAALALGACAFEPRGEGVADDDAPPADDDAPTADAPDIDAPDIDAPVDAPIDAVDARIIDAPSTCPITYDVVAGQSRYRFVTSVDSLGDAITDCVNDVPGLTHLATFEDPADLETTHAGRGGSEMFWVHATCSSLAAIECDNTNAWTWQPDAELVAAALWGDGEPNNPLVERNAITFKQNGDWRLNNVVATEQHAYLCECGD